MSLKTALLLFAALSFTTSLHAVETKVIRDDTFEEFNQGESTGTEVLAQGRLRIAPLSKRLDITEEGVAWDVAVDPYDGNVFFVTGHNGKVFRWVAGNKAELWADLTEVEAISVAIDPKGGVLVGASPGGKIYRIVEKGKPKLFFETKEQYVWDMIFDRSGLLYAATGPNGKVFRIRGQNNGEVYYDSDATNIMAVNFDRDGNVIVATQGKAYVIRVTGARQGYVLYAGKEDECRTLTVDQFGNIYAAINSARISSVFTSSSSGSSVSETESLTGERSGTASSSSQIQSSSLSARTSSFSSGLGGSSMIIQIQPNGFVSNFWRSPEGPIQALLADLATHSILVAAGNKGKIYRLYSDTNYSVISDVEEPMVLAMTAHKQQVYFVTANKASLYELVSLPTHEGLFASRPLNAGSTVHWGNLLYEAEETTGSVVSFETRSGNTPDPDDGTWSGWKASTRVGSHIMRVESPVAQFLQYKTTLKPSAGSDLPILDSIQLFFIQKNVSPIVRTIRIEKVGGESTGMTAADLANLLRRTAASSGSSQPSGGSSDSQRSSDDKEPPSGSQQSGSSQSSQSRDDRDSQRSQSSTGSRVGVVENTQKVNISWEVMDPNGDKLRSRLYFKGEDETVWKLIEKDLTRERFTFSTAAIPDGRYRFKVEITDAPENPETSASLVSTISRIYVVDNSSPEIQSLKSVKTGPNRYEITASASDVISILSTAEYNVDAADEWRAVFPEDGIFDFYRESFKFVVQPEKDMPEHTLSLRVYDREGNSRVEKVLLR